MTLAVKVALNPNTTNQHKNLAMSKLKAFADDIIIVTQHMKFVFHMKENMGKGENVGYHNFLGFFCTVFNHFPADT